MIRSFINISLRNSYIADLEQGLLLRKQHQVYHGVKSIGALDEESHLMIYNGFH
jgi:hypothetical protein